MKFLKLTFISIISILLLASCSKEEVQEYLDKIFNTNLTDAEVVEGLKTALIVGTDTSTSQLSAEDGYFRDLAVKILLPQEIQNKMNSFKSKSVSFSGFTITGEDLYDGYTNNTLGIDIPSLKDKEDELILGINRAAEYAAKEAGPIFVDAITDMSIIDAKEILFTDDTTAATKYLVGTTSDKLFTKFEPEIDAALKAVKVNNTSVVDLYEDYVSQYNSILNTELKVNDIINAGTIGDNFNLNPVQATDLSAYSTEKGLDGLYLKISEEEGAIRRDPLARVTEVLQKVFSELDNRTE